MNTKPIVLIVEDDPEDRAALAEMITSLGYAVETAGDGEEALAKLEAHHISAIVTDLMMPRMDGFELLKTLVESGQMTPAIVLTGFGNIGQAVSIVHELRAFWFLEKPAEAHALGTLLERAIHFGSLAHEKEQLQRQLSYHGVLGDLVGSSRPMQEAYSLIQRVAPTQASVLITGESGTGKEMVARTVHKLSPRANRPFVAINCAALPHDLIESELFGHEKGAFTGAVGRHAGAFEQAHGGTFLLDEIGEMPMAMQARLLRVLEESKVRRLGASGEIPVDVRVLAATNRSIEESLENRTLREDLFYRLNVFHIHLPALRERKDDIAPLAHAIIGDLNRKHDCHVTNLHPSTLDRLLSHSWPGNVRELRNALEWAVITAASDVLLPKHLPKGIGTGAATVEIKPALAAAGGGMQFPVGRTLDEIEAEYILETLKSTNNDRRKTAQLLGISLRTLYNWLSRSRGVAVGAEDSGSDPVIR